ncbi:hypothetical protein QQ551_004401 [Escherichia coli]
MNNSTSEDRPDFSFNYMDNQRADEIKALKILLFSIIRNMPHDTAIRIINNIVNTDNNEALNRLCLEITDAMLNTTKIVDYLLSPFIFFLRLAAINCQSLYCSAVISFFSIL